MSDIVDFYINGCKNSNGVSLDDIARFSVDEMEMKHNYIQWIFPLPEKSSFVECSPVLSKENYMLLVKEKERSGFGSNFLMQVINYFCFLNKTLHWRVEKDHNHMRISRMIKSISLFFGPELASKYLQVLKDLIGEDINKISPISIKFWEESVNYGLDYKW